MSGLERDLGQLWKLLQVEEIILWQGSLSLMPPEGRGVDTMTSGSPSAMEGGLPISKPANTAEQVTLFKEVPK